MFSSETVKLYYFAILLLYGTVRTELHQPPTYKPDTQHTFFSPLPSRRATRKGKARMILRALTEAPENILVL